MREKRRREIIRRSLLVRWNLNGLMIFETIVARRYLGLMTRPALFAPHFLCKRRGRQFWGKESRSSTVEDWGDCSANKFRPLIR